MLNWVEAQPPASPTEDTQQGEQMPWVPRRPHTHCHLASWGSGQSVAMLATDLQVHPGVGKIRVLSAAMEPAAHSASTIRDGGQGLLGQGDVLLQAAGSCRWACRSALLEFKVGHAVSLLLSWSQVSIDKMVSSCSVAFFCFGHGEQPLQGDFGCSLAPGCSLVWETHQKQAAGKTQKPEIHQTQGPQAGCQGFSTLCCTESCPRSFGCQKEQPGRWALLQATWTHSVRGWVMVKGTPLLRGRGCCVHRLQGCGSPEPASTSGV